MPETSKTERKRKNYLKLLAYLEKHPCVKCGEKDLMALEFDHVRGVKHKDVNELLKKGHSWDTIMIEIRKCNVICANCHKKVSAKRGKYMKWTCFKLFREQQRLAIA